MTHHPGEAPQAPAPSTAPDTVPDRDLGMVLEGRYRVDSLLGRGAWGRVYRASHLGIGRPVAIKFLDPQVTADDDARRRFEREAQATGRLRHPNCVSVTDFGATADGGRYLVMELADGVNLADLLANESRLPLPRAVHIMRHILRGLAHAHGHGLVHRDLKPPNIILVNEGGDRDFAKILDFGLARMVGGDDRVTRTGTVAGTPRYMAPEQVLDRGFDGRVDLYAASVILFEMLAGRTPFEHDDMATLLRMHVAAPAPRVADVAPDVVVPPALDDLIRRGLAKRPDERPASAEHYLAELDRACAPVDGTIELTTRDPAIVPATNPPVASATPAVPPAMKPATVPRRHHGLTPRQIAIGGSVAAILVIGIVAAIAGGGSRPRPAPAASTVPQEPLELEPESAPSEDPAIVEALRLAQAGRGAEAALRLRDLRRRRPEDPRIPYALGRIYQKLGWSKQTIDAYREAIRLDAALRDDPQLIRDLVGLLESRSSWQVAARVLEQEIGEAAIPALTDAAEHHRDATVRKRAAQVRDSL